MRLGGFQWPQRAKRQPKEGSQEQTEAVLDGFERLPCKGKLEGNKILTVTASVGGGRHEGNVSA